MYNGLEIRNNTRFIIKHIGLGLLGVGLILTVFQFWIPKVFPASTIITAISLIMQVIGCKEPFWFSCRLGYIHKHMR